MLRDLLNFFEGFILLEWLSTFSLFLNDNMIIIIGTLAYAGLPVMSESILIHSSNSR